MADHPISPGGEKETKRKQDAATPGLDPASSSRFGEIIDADRGGHDYSIDPQPLAFDMKRERFSLLTWVMIVVAGVVLGVAMAMIAAG